MFSFFPLSAQVESEVLIIFNAVEQSRKLTRTRVQSLRRGLIQLYPASPLHPLSSPCIIYYIFSRRENNPSLRVHILPCTKQLPWRNKYIWGVWGHDLWNHGRINTRRIYPLNKNKKNNNYFRGYYLGLDFFMYFIQHCFTWRPTDVTVSEDAGIELLTVETIRLHLIHESSRSHME